MFTLFASLLFCLLCFALTRLPASVPLSRKVLAGLLFGALFGLALQLGWAPMMPASSRLWSGSISSAVAMSACSRW
ncbi:hypothetical protein ACSZOF_01195 [Aeromonas veronii]